MLRLILLLSSCGLGLCVPGAARLVCYTTSGAGEGCSHVVYEGVERGEKLDAALKDLRKLPAKLLLSVNEDDKDLPSLLKTRALHGLELHAVHRALDRGRATRRVQEARAALAAAGGGPLLVRLPASPELLAKYYDLREIADMVDVFVAETHELGRAKKMTYHPSRLSGVWDMMNTDSVVDLIVGLGVPASKIVITLSPTALHFRLANETLSTPGSPTLDEQPTRLDRAALCKKIGGDKWMMERDQDLSAPYAFKGSDWIAFEDTASVDVKGKYARVRGIAGLALADTQDDAATECGPALLAALRKVLNSQKRAPRRAVLRSLETEILSAAPLSLQPLQLSPYRITQVVDSDGVIHSVREDSRTEFACSRQGYFVHPRTCARFYRCVKFDQLSPDYTVFEFDCPAGLAFDSRYEVCVWPGSIPDSQACPGSAEIAPVPRARFQCPSHEGYYADPENCRWFFACLDHGQSHLSAYEFRCPFGLGFDSSRLLCDWPWLVPGCGDIASYEAAFGYSGAALGEATGFLGQSADAVNVAAHHSLTYGASLNNLVGVQSHTLPLDDVLNANYIAAPELDSAQPHYAAKYPDYDTEITGALIKDEFRQPLVQPASYLNPNSYVNAGYDNTQYSNVALDTAHSYKNTASEDVEVTGSLIKDVFIEKKPQIYVSAANDENSYVGFNQHGYNENNFNYVAAIKDFVAYADKQENPNLYVKTSGNSNTNAYVNYNDNTFDKNIEYTAAKRDFLAYADKKDGYEISRTLDGLYNNAFANLQQNRYQTSVVNNGEYLEDDSGAYVHDSTGDVAEPYRHQKSEIVPYLSYSDEHRQKIENYNQKNSEYTANYAGAYVKDDSKSLVSDSYIAGVYTNNMNNFYNSDAKILNYDSFDHSVLNQISGNIYDNLYNGQYVSNDKVYSGGAHTLTAGAINVGLVGKTKLVDADTYYTEGGQSSASRTQTFNVHHPSVKVTNVGSDSVINKDYAVTTVNSIGVTPTATPVAVTSAPATTYIESSYVSQQPKTDIKTIFGYQQPAVTFANPAKILEHTQPTIQLYHDERNDKYERGDIEQTVEVEHSGYDYPKPTIAFEEPFKKVVAYTTGPSTITSPKVHAPKEYVQQTVHTETQNIVPLQNFEISNYEYQKPIQPVLSTPTPFRHEIPREYPTPQPPIITSTLPSVKNVEINGYDYPKPSSVTVYQNPLIHVEENVTPITTAPAVYSTSTPAYVASTEQHIPVSPVVQTHGVEQFINPVKYEIPSIKQVYTYQPTQETYLYSPEIQRDIESIASYRPSAISHQIIHQSTGYQDEKVNHNDVAFVSSTPSNIIYDDRYEHKAHIVQQNYESYVPVSSTPAEIIQKEAAVIPQVSLTYKTNSAFVSSTPSNIIYDDRYEYKAPIVKQNYESYVPVSSTPAEIIQKEGAVIPQVSLNYKTNSAFVSSTPSNIIYDDRYEYKAPIVQQNYESYIPVSSTPAQITQKEAAVIPQVSLNHKTENEFLSSTPSNIIYDDRYEYKAPVVQHNYESYIYSTSAPIIQKEAVVVPQVSLNYKSGDYSKDYKYETNTPSSHTVHVTHGYSESLDDTHVANKYQNYQQEQYQSEEYVAPVQVTNAPEYLPPVTTTKYITPESITEVPSYLPPGVSTYSPSTISTTTPEYLPPITEKKYVYIPPRETYVPATKAVYTSTARAPTSTSDVQTLYKASEYLPPEDSAEVNFEGYGLKQKARVFPVTEKYEPKEEYYLKQSLVTPTASTTVIPRHQNIVVQTAKSQTNLLGYGTVGPDAGLVTSGYYSTAYPETVPQKYSTIPTITSTIALPIENDSEYVTPSPAPIIRNKPKVAVVTKINDFNPLLVRKLGAVCSCQSPVVVLRGEKPEIPQFQYGEDDDVSYNDNIDDSQWAQKSLSYKTPNNEYLPVTTTRAKLVTSTFNPIIVPDDSYYQDYPDDIAQINFDSAASTTFAPTTKYASNERIIRINPKVQAVTVAPTLKTVLVNNEPEHTVKVNAVAASLDRYGPGGWRSRDETLQGSVDCKRAGLFRHPKHCNKFYACRWDCTKERFTLHVFNCPVQLSFDPNVGACNWPSQGPACQGDTLLTNGL